MDLNQHEVIVIRTDGSCEPKNPGGIACCAWTLSDPEADKPFWSEARVVADGGDLATNNFAEYCGLGFALRYLVDNDWQGQTLVVYSDSMLLVNQVTGKWKCKAPHLRKLKDRIVSLIDQIGLHIVSMDADEVAGCLSASNDFIEMELLNTCALAWNSRDENEFTDALCERVYRAYLKKSAGLKSAPW